MLVRKGCTDRAFEEIRGHLVSDEDFRQRFEREPKHSSNTVRHLLRKLDPISRPDSGGKPFEVDVEHILPRSVVSKLVDGKKLTPNVIQWIKDLGFEIPKTRKEKRELGKKLEPYLNMLGNQALFYKGANRRARNLPFAKKKGFYVSQALELTKQIAECDSWDLGQIEKRQRRLAREALKDLEQLVY